MKTSQYITAATLIALLSTNSNAVHISPQGVGQVLIFPYYTAQMYDPNTLTSLNTTYSIVNTTNEAKAVKIKFMEGENSIVVLSFNIYLSAYDVWTGVTGAKDNGDHPGNIGGAHATGETTCAPLLPSVIDFDPIQIVSLDSVSVGVALERSLDGHFAAIEMGTLNSADAALVDHSFTGVPSGCVEIENRWRIPDGTWLNEDSTLGPVSGGLYGGASILDVSEGYAISYNAIALEDFWGASLQGQHTQPSDLAPSLADAAPVSRVFKDQAFNSPGMYDGGGYVLETNWPSNRGIDAVSALFMTTAVKNEYVYDEGRDTKTEWVITFPTKQHYIATEPTAPFTEVWDNSTSCDRYEYSTWDREQQVGPTPQCDVFTIGYPNCYPVICYAANVVEFLRPGSSPNTSSQILGSSNLITIQGPDLHFATASGWAAIKFEESTMVLTGGQGPSYKGLPAVGFMVQRYTNANAQPGLLAQYAAAFNHVMEISTY